MPGVPARFIESLRRLGPSFSIRDVGKIASHLAPSTISVYLSQLTTSGELTVEGRGQRRRYHWADLARPGDGAELRDLPRAAWKIADALRSSLMPSVWPRIVVWSDEELAPYVEDALLRGFLVLEAPSALLDSIEEALRPKFLTLRLKNRTTLARRLWDSRSRGEEPDAFLLPQTSLRGTVPTRIGFRLPLPERLLLDVLRMEPLLPRAPFALVDRDTFDARSSLAIAGHRGQTALVASFLTLAAITLPQSRVAHEMRRMFPHLRYV